MEQISTEAVCVGQSCGKVELLAPGVKRWQLRDIVFNGDDGQPVNELTEVWVEVVKASGRARFHCWTNAMRECSEEHFSIWFCFRDAGGRPVHETGWRLSIPGDLGVECRLEADFPPSAFDASTTLDVPRLRQRTRPCGP